MLVKHIVLKRTIIAFLLSQFVSRVSAFFEEVSSPMVGGVSPYTGYNTYVQLQRVW